MSLITNQAAYDAFLAQGGDLSGYDRYTALPGELSLQSLPEYKPGSFYTVDAAERVARRSMRDALAESAGLTLDQARQAEADFRRYGEYNDDYKALMRAYEQTDHYRKLKANDEDGALGNIFDESQWTRLPNGQNLFSNLLTAGLYAGAGALMGGFGAAGAAGGSSGGAAGATNAAFAIPTATELGLAAGAGNSALLAGTSAGSLAGAGALAGGAAGAGVSSGSGGIGSGFNMPGPTEMGLYSGAGDSALMAGTSSGGLGGVGAAGAAAAAAGSGGGASKGGLMADMTMKDWLGIGATVAGAMGSDSPSSHSTTSTNSPPAWLLPYLQQGAGAAQSAFFSPLSYYPGQTYADLTPEQLQAQSMMTDYADSLSGPIGNLMSAQNFALSGDILNPESNPHLQASAEAAIRPIQQNLSENILPGIRSRAVSQGAYSGNRAGIQEAQAIEGATRAMGDVTSNMYSNAYQQGLQQQARMAALAPQNFQMGLLPSQIYSQVGGQNQAQNQYGIDEAMARHQFGQTAPRQNISDYMSILQGGGFGGTQTQTSPIYRNRAAGLLGGAMAGYDLAGDVGWNPTTGAIMGGILGGWM